MSSYIKASEYLVKNETGEVTHVLADDGSKEPVITVWKPSSELHQKVTTQHGKGADLAIAYYITEVKSALGGIMIYAEYLHDRIVPNPMNMRFLLRYLLNGGEEKMLSEQ